MSVPYLKSSLLLRVMVQSVREGGKVVPDTAAHGYRDLFASRLQRVHRRQRRKRARQRAPHSATLR